jgi:hypothetical protein
VFKYQNWIPKLVQLSCRQAIYGPPWRTSVSLPGIDDAVAILVEEGYMLLQHALLPALMPIPLGPLRMVHIRHSQCSSQICIYAYTSQLWNYPCLADERSEETRQALTWLWEAGLQVCPDRPLRRHWRPLRHRRHCLCRRLGFLGHGDALLTAEGSPQLSLINF